MPSPGNQHCHTAQEKYGPSNGKKPPCYDPPGFLCIKAPAIIEFVYKPVLVADDHDEPDEEEGHSSQLCHLKCPGYVRHVIQDYVRQRWVSVIGPLKFWGSSNYNILGHVRNTIVNHSHHKSCQPGHSHPIPKICLFKGKTGNTLLKIRRIIFARSNNNSLHESQGRFPALCRKGS